ncbi:hypothetical protein PoB_001219400 [Plakobranchus ocellatus]|uniref:Uncharacterized protein n=1 Tax=Plakobranchus ocellatus TaxID=259542 RepID=A0AAV3YUT9_9GAST|nr:hypothetical protein PoB_001219400 [Plakobranchus ocellatus]
MILLGYSLIMLAVFNGTQPLQSAPNIPALKAMARAPHSNMFAAARAAVSMDGQVALLHSSPDVRSDAGIVDHGPQFHSVISQLDKPVV